MFANLSNDFFSGPGRAVGLVCVHVFVCADEIVFNYDVIISDPRACSS